MNVSIGERQQALDDREVSDGRDGAPGELTREGLQLDAERQAKLFALRATLDASIAQGGEVTDEELDADIAARSAELRRFLQG